MATSSLPVLESDPNSQLNVEIGERRVDNIFVTQPEDARQRKGKSVNPPPALTKPPSRVLQAGLKTLKKTQLDQKQAELDEVDIQLAVKRQEFKNRLEALALRRSELESKQQQAREKTIKFEKFISENEAKRHGALKKCEATREQNVLKQREIEDLTEQLNQLRARKHILKEKTAKSKIYEDYLMKTLDHLPNLYRDSGYDSLVMPIIRRHETLSITHQEQLQRLRQMEEEFEQGQRQLQAMKQECSVRKLLASRELSELQGELESLREKNKQAEVDLIMEQGVSRVKAEEMGRLLMAISSLAQQCYLPAFGSLERMTVLTMMDMVKEYILDKADTERRARKLMEHGLTTASTATLTDKKDRGPVKGIGSKTLLTSSSKVRKRNETFN
ncbi:coiled-coil domain-containing protein 42 like-2 [Kryptolebias marmoratus]|uniref:coiled-coil domain-containing protein 42 like-2 n=1 Tax=Kryptolebias marmoratus TaxID=37003 RepID=UPI0007F90AB9|nr:coiled-coil domain-containing protein 42 like-2 [Kryptolebias marmoratus]